jgi:hypothetical protein
MTDLSPATQAVLDVFTEDNCLHDRKHNYYNLEALAAALRAAADQVAPEDYSCYTGHLEHDFAMEARNDSVREAILAIADELEGVQ